MTAHHPANRFAAAAAAAAAGDRPTGPRAWRALAAAFLAIGLLWLAGCGSLPAAPERRDSTAWPARPGSALAQIAHDSSPSADLSGLRLLPLGVYALDARLQLIDRAVLSIDVQ